MKLSTAVIQTLEMSHEEEAALWDTFYTDARPLVCGKKALQWHTGDGCNDMLLEGEQTFRKIILTTN